MTLYAAGEPITDSKLPESVISRRARREGNIPSRRSGKRVKQAPAHTSRSPRNTSSTRTQGKMTTAGPVVERTLNASGKAAVARNALRTQGTVTHRGKAVAKDAASTKLNMMAVKGSREVMESPLSAKAWSKAAARTGVAAGLSYFLTPVVGGRVEEMLHNFGYRKILLGVVACIVGVFGTAFLGAMTVVAIVASVVSIPGQIVDSVIDFFFGDDPQVVIECVTVDPLPSRPGGYPAGYRAPESGAPITSLPPLSAPVVDGVVQPPTTGADTSREDPATWATLAPSYTPSPEQSPPAAEAVPVEAYTPPPSLGSDGRPTPHSLSVMQGIPTGADARQAEAWVLYALTHPDTDPLREWNAFGKRFAEELSALRDIGTIPGPDGVKMDVQAQSGAMDIVTRIDNAPYYEAHTLTAAAMLLEAARNKKVTLTPEQENNLYERVISGCGFTKVDN